MVDCQPWCVRDAALLLRLLPLYGEPARAIYQARNKHSDGPACQLLEVYGQLLDKYSCGDVRLTSVNSRLCCVGAVPVAKLQQAHHHFHYILLEPQRCIPRGNDHHWISHNMDDFDDLVGCV